MEFKDRSFKLFIISGVIIFIAFTFATFWESFGLGENKIPLAISIIVAFGISIIGLIFGISEYSNKKNKKVIIAIVGHILILIFFIYTIIYSYNYN